MCGLFGLKPTRGRVSLGPAEHEAWAGLVMRHVVTRSVRDSAAVLDVLQGYMTGDWYTAPLPARAVRRRGRHGSREAAHRSAHDRAARARDRRSRVHRRGRSHGPPVGIARSHRGRGRAPPRLDDGALLETFTTVMVGVAARRPRRRRRGDRPAGDRRRRGTRDLGNVRRRRRDRRRYLRRRARRRCRRGAGA